jgi:hypothetical protein
LPLTQEATTDLINSGIPSDLMSKAVPTGPYEASPLAPLVKQLLGIPPTGGAPPGPAQSEPAAPFWPLPLPLMVFGQLVGSLLAEQKAPAGSADEPPQSAQAQSAGHAVAGDIPGDKGSAGGAAQPPSPGGGVSMAYVGMGTPHTVGAHPPVVYNGRCYPPEFFPGRRPEDLVEITDSTTRQWWQHWPFNYAKNLRETKYQDSGG